MDRTERKISRIARAAQRYVNGSLAKLGVGSTEYECLLLIRKNEGTTQSFLQERLYVRSEEHTTELQSQFRI